MDWKTSLDWYCSGNTLDEEDLQILQNQYEHFIDNHNPEQSLEVAPKHICNQTKIPEGSTWIMAVATVLDRLNPSENKDLRSLKVNNLSGKKRS
tara:strand:- start:114 stop:395 length:282 start_codon:yes stop_codon:yes gene_type:complete